MAGKPLGAKAIEAPSTLVMLLLFLVIIAVLVILVLYFGKSINTNEGFNKWTDITKVFS